LYFLHHPFLTHAGSGGTAQEKFKGGNSRGRMGEGGSSHSETSCSNIGAICFPDKEVMTKEKVMLITRQKNKRYYDI